MQVYKDKNMKQLLLNPDDYYHDYDIHQKLYAFYKSLQIPNNVESIIGMHIRYEITSYPYETNPDVYQEVSFEVLELIKNYIHCDTSYMYFDESNDFYIVLFNEQEDDLCEEIEQLYENLKRYQFQYHEQNCFINIKAGIYYAPKNVNAYYLYEASRHILEISLKHQQAYISIYHSFN